MAYDRESIIRKLKKLRAKAESAEAIGSEAEAQTFAEAIQRMLTDYKVEEAEFATDHESEVDPIKQVSPPTGKHKLKFKHRESLWERDLASIVAYSHYCRISFIPKTNILFFNGREADAEIAAEVWCKLVVVAESIADKEYVKYFYEAKRGGDVKKARGFRLSFLMGFVSRLSTRYSDHMRQIQEYYAHDKNALLVLKNARGRVNDWLKDKVRAVQDEVRPDIQNFEAFVRGKVQADHLPLSGPQIEKETK